MASRNAGPQENDRMATAAPNISLPLFYNAIEPLNVTQHGKMKIRAGREVAADRPDPRDSGDRR